jgi:hypothetical protein
MEFSSGNHYIGMLGLQTGIRFPIGGHYDITARGQLLQFAQIKAACVLNQPYVRHIHRGGRTISFIEIIALE